MSVVQMNNSSNEQLVQTGSSTVQKGGGKYFHLAPPYKNVLLRAWILSSIVVQLMYNNNIIGPISIGRSTHFRDLRRHYLSFLGKDLNQYL